MKSQHSPMTGDEFQRLPHRLGWTHEYYGDKAHITPSEMAIVTASLPVTRQSVAAPCLLRPPKEDDLNALIPAYYAAFADTIDYCDGEMKAIVKAAQKNLTGFFAGERGRPLPAARLAVDGGKIVGAAMLVEKKDGRAFLDLLFVIPGWRRRGVANALLADALNALHDAGYPELSSRFMLGNEASREWHHRFGFVDKPDRWMTTAYYRHYQHEWERQQAIGALSPAEMAALAAQRDHWDAVIDELDALSRKEGVYMIFPSLD